MEKHVLSNWFAWLDAIWILTRLDREKSDRLAASGTVSYTNRTDAAVRFLDTAANTSACCTNGHADDAKGTGDFYA